MHTQKNNADHEQWQTRVHLAAMFRLTHMMGWDDTVWNHITARVPNTEHQFFMHRFGLLYEEITASNLIKVNDKGQVIEGPSHINTTGFIIHSAVYLHYPHYNFVFHTHPPSAIAATVFADDIPFLVQDSSMLYGKVGYHNWEGISTNQDERSRLAENLRNKTCLIMRNHGLLSVGETAGEAFMHMYYLIRLCETALQAHATNLAIGQVHQKLWELSHQQYQDFLPGTYEWPALLRRCDRADPSYKY